MSNLIKNSYVLLWKLWSNNDIITSFDKNGSVCIDNSQKYLSDSDIALNLVYINSNFEFLPDVITCLQARNISLFDGIEITENVYLKLTQALGPMRKLVRRKIDDVLSKNTGYKT